MKKLDRYPYITITLAVINGLFYLINLITRDRLYNWGELSVVSTLIQKDYSRVVKAMFLHGGANHLFSNMIVLIFLGMMLEEEIGHIWHFVIYMLSGIGGNILSILMRAIQGEYYISSVGASGAVFGMDGVLLALVLFSGRRIQSATPQRVVVMVGLSLYSGFAGSNIDNAAHVGGLLVGFLLGTIVCLIQRYSRKNNRHNIYG